MGLPTLARAFVYVTNEAGIHWRIGTCLGTKLLSLVHLFRVQVTIINQCIRHQRPFDKISQYPSFGGKEPFGNPSW